MPEELMDELTYEMTVWLNEQWEACAEYIFSRLEANMLEELR